MKQYDFTIIGGGIFGVYAAVYLAKAGAEICLIEKENQLFQRASTINQARIHSGYHYPRSIATAALSDEYKARFIREHQRFINFSFEHFYAIDKFSSVTDAAQFERFCEHLKIPCKRISEVPFLKKNRLEAIYQTEEFSFDPGLIADFYREKLSKLKNVFVEKSTVLNKVEKSGNKYLLSLNNIENQQAKIVATSNLINATYSGTNEILRLFEFDEIKLTHELVEIAFVKTKQNMNLGVTVMDGQFGSLMPYGLSDFHTLSSVAYTPHEVSVNGPPKFSCQEIHLTCRPGNLENCNNCHARPTTNFQKMKSHIGLYLNDEIDLEYGHSKFTIKSKLSAGYIDDRRPTQISKLSENPGFYCIFAGKINSIYEIEKIIKF